MPYIRRTLRAEAAIYPGAVETVGPDGRVFKVAGKPFVHLGRDTGPLVITARLPESAAVVLTLPGVVPADGARGRARWITATYPSPREVAVEILLEWIEESYRATAPAKLLAGLSAALAERDYEEPEVEPMDPLLARYLPRPAPRRKRSQTRRTTDLPF